MRGVALRATFNLEGVTKGEHGELIVRGRYGAVGVVVSYQHVSSYDFTYVTLHHGGISTASYFGKCCRKVLADVLRAVKETSEGRLWLLKDDYLQRFVVTISRQMEEWNDKEKRSA